jgi:hypothetical protein
MDKQRIDLIPTEIQRHIGEGVAKFVTFEGLSPQIGKELLTGWPNVDPEDVQNASPTMQEMVDITLKHKGTLKGYIIPVETEREDARIRFDGFTIKIPKKGALELKKKLKPKDFQECGQDTFWFWWD